MKQKPLLIAACAAWIGTVCGAFLIGKGVTRPADEFATARGGRVEAETSNKRLSALGAREPETGQAERAGAGLRGSSDALLLLKGSLANRNPVQRMQSFMEALAMMDEDDYEAALAELEGEMRAGESQREIGLLLYAWAEKDGASALAYLDDLELGRRGWSLYSSALTAWGGSDPDAAVAWAVEKHEGKEGNDNWHMLGVINGVVKNDVLQAAQLAQDIGYGRARGEALGTVVEELFKQGDEAAMSWIESLGNEDERFRAGAAGRVASELARKDPQAAGDWVVGLDLAEKDRAVASVASQWGREAPEEAADWALNLEDPELRSGGVASVVEAWARRDPNAAGSWLGEMPASAELDSPVRTYALMVRARDPGAAITWANTITDEKMRGETVERIGGEWVRSNPEEAKAFLRQQDSVPEGLQRYLN